MKKEETKYIQVKKKEVQYICDICGKTVKNNKGCCGSSPIMKCDKCDIDVCSKCRLLHFEGGSDYPSGCYCLACWDIGKKYKQQMEEAYTDYENTLDTLEDKWKEDCITNRAENPLTIKNTIGDTTSTS